MIIGIRQEPTGNSRKLKFLLCALGALFLAFCAHGEGQQMKIPRIGYLSGSGDASNQGPYVEALRQGLRELGYVDGKNVKIEYRGAEGKIDRIDSLVNELISLKVDLLFIPIPSALRKAKQTTKTIPIVFVGGSGGDLVSAGIVDSLARPGGNVTGIATLSVFLSGKRLELLTEAIPGLSRVGVLRHRDASTTSGALAEYEAAARALNIEFRPLDLRGPNPDLEDALQRAHRAGVNALVTITSASLFVERERLASLAIKTRLPSMYQGPAWVEAGGLMSYASNDLDAFRRAATYVDKILKGAKPADLPVEQASKFELVINLKTAKQIALTIPPNVLARADRVIR